MGFAISLKEALIMKGTSSPTIKNLTLAARIDQLFPTSDLHLRMDRAQKTQDDFRVKLEADPTKTKA